MLTLIGFGAFVVASAFMGVRLLLLHRRTRRVPELTMGLAFICGGAMAFPLMTLAQSFEPGSGPAIAALLAGRLGSTVGAASLYLFTWLVFRRESAAGKTILASGLLALTVGMIGPELYFGMGVRMTDGPWFWLVVVARGASYLWAAVESLWYWRGMRRRQRLGLADPLVANRFLLWGVASVAPALIFTLTGLAALFPGPAVQEALTNATSVCGFASAVTIWLAFFPPARYARWIASPERGPE
ncbi:MAG: hypothetical protein MJE66_18645 [Proteobacteria bacterium]|nr:hypothetical protein [Pseudomonadota bacterium]